MTPCTGHPSPGPEKPVVQNLHLQRLFWEFAKPLGTAPGRRSGSNLCLLSPVSAPPPPSLDLIRRRCPTLAHLASGVRHRRTRDRAAGREGTSFPQPRPTGGQLMGGGEGRSGPRDTRASGWGPVQGPRRREFTHRPLGLLGGASHANGGAGRRKVGGPGLGAWQLEASSLGGTYGPQRHPPPASDRHGLGHAVH